MKWRRDISRDALNKCLISLLIVVYLMFIALWLLSKERDHHPAFVLPVEDVLIFFGLRQRCAPFEKVPTKNYYATAIVMMADGSNRLIELPRLEKMGWWERFQRYRWRKWVLNFSKPSAKAAVAVDGCCYLARVLENSKNQPEIISIVLHSTAIPQPTNSSIMNTGSRGDTTRTAVFVYRLPTEVSSK